MGLIPAHGDSQGIEVIVLITIFWVFAALAVAGRVWARRLTRSSLVLNDYAIYVAFFIGTGLIANVITTILLGGEGQHIQFVRPDQLIVYLKIIVSGSILWACANLAIKISILDLYVKIFYVRPFRIASYTVGAMATGLALLIVFQALFICRPFNYNWNKSINGSCGNIDQAFLIQAIINFCIDVMIVILPIPLLFKLQMPLPKKLGVYFMFSVGIAICVITALRIHSALTINASDPTYVGVYAILTCLETLLGIFNACLPVLRPVLRKIFGSNSFGWFTSFGNNSKTGGSGSNYRRRLLSALRFGNSDAGSKNEHFQQLENQVYPMNNIDSSRNETHVKAQSARSLKRDDLEAQLITTKGVEPADAIRVTRAWDVGSTGKKAPHAAGDAGL